MGKHVIKYEYRDGVRLPKHETVTWCGGKVEWADWLFQDAQHALLSVEQCSSLEPCGECMKAIIAVAEKVVL